MHAETDALADPYRLVVADRPDAQRYELLLDDDVVGFATYSTDGDVVTIPHVETRADHRGKDFAARLMDGVVTDLRARSLSVRPLCGYARAYIHRRPETHDLLPPAGTTR